MKRSGIEIEGKECVIIGRSNIVGKPMAALLLRENATVTVAHSKTKDLKSIAKRADILIVAIGKAKFITKDYIKEGAVVIDVGMHRDEQNHLCGDVDCEDVSSVVSAITPVPGGVGPMTIAMLMNNCVETIRGRGGKSMKCVHCGANIPDDQMICPVCGAEVQIVPDYNPLDDVLAREVRGSVEGATRQIRTDDIRRYRREDLTKNINSTRVLSEDEMERIRSNRRKSTNNTERNSAELRRQRQARQEKRLEAAKRKRRRLLLTLAAVVILIGFGIYVAYQNSYTGMLKKGYRAVNEKEYMAAEKYFDRAIIKR